MSRKPVPPDHPIVFIYGNVLDNTVSRLLHVYEHAIKKSGGVPLPPLSMEQLAEMMILYDYIPLAIKYLGLHVIDSHVISRYLRSELVKLQIGYEKQDEE